MAVKVIGVIPARYASSRLPGKPLADICGKPMVWWVYQQAIQSSRVTEVHVAVDDVRVADVCAGLGIPTVMTSVSHMSHINRLHEVAENVEGDLYVAICGDEPLIQKEVIEQVIRKRQMRK